MSDETKCRCRECNRNDVPVTEMAVHSFKPMLNMRTGVCNSCMKKMWEEEARIAALVEKDGEEMMAAMQSQLATL